MTANLSVVADADNDVVLEPAAAVSPETPSRRDHPRGAGGTAVRWAGMAALTVAALAVLLAVFEVWVTDVQEVRSQSTLLDELKSALDVGLAQGDPFAAPAPGDPVGLLEIPSLGVEKVVVEGASPSRSKEGPGHAPGTALPGEAGSALIVGRRGTYGAPFHNLDRLKPEDTIVITNGRGRFTYIVSDSGLGAPGDGELVLATSRRSPFGGGTTIVRANLDGHALAHDDPATGKPATRAFTDAAAVDGLARDATKPVSEPAAAVPALAMLALLIGALLVVRRLYRRWSPWATYLVSTPIILALLFLTLGSLDRLLPATA